MTNRTEAMDALIAQDADLIDVPADGPALYIFFAPDGHREYGHLPLSKSDKKHGWTETPLYTRPPVDAALLDEVREVREALVDGLRSASKSAPGLRVKALVATVEQAHAALAKLEGLKP